MRGNWAGWCLALIILIITLLHVSGEDIAGVVLGGGSSSYCLWNEPASMDDTYVVCATVSPSVRPPPPASTAIIFTLNTSNTTMVAGVTESWHLSVEHHGWRYTFDDTLLPGTWRQLCLAYLHHRHTVAAYIRERESEVLSKVVVEDGSNQSENIPSGFCLGSPVDGHNSLVGTIMAVSVTTHNLLVHQKEVIDHSDCSQLIPVNDILVFNSSWNVSGEAQVVNFENKELCDNIYNTVTLRFVGSHTKMLQQCRLLGGRFPFQSEILSGVVKIYPRLSDTCITDAKFLSWLGVNSGGDKGLWSKCSVLLTNGSVSRRYCISELECSVCLVPVALRFSLYGPIRNMDRTYILRSTFDGKMYFIGEGASQIRQMNNAWILSSNLHAQKLTLEKSSLPIGRYRWKTPERLEGHVTSEEQLTVTSCGEAQFSCDSGECIPRRQKCDGLEQCSDNSDETYCNLMVRANGYNKYISPAKSKSNNHDSGKVSHNKITFSVAVHSIGPISTLDGKVTIEMSFVFEWYEDRMKYWELTEEPNFLDCVDIWVPELIVKSGHKEGMGHHLDVYHTSCYVEKVQGVHQHTDREDPNMGQYFDGWEQPLKYEIKFRMTIPCNFKLHRYPFGSHVCPGTFYVLNGGQPSMVFEAAANNSDVNYTGNHDLLEYELRRVTHEHHHDYIVVMLHLRSLYDYHVLNSFLPSALVFLISLTTLFFPVGDFNERIMVSLTVMVVLAALFTQASSASVKTPYFKLLDIWYTALVALCFIVVVVNAIVHSIMSKRDVVNVVPKDLVNFSRHEGKRIIMAKKFNFFATVVMFAIFFGLIIVYVMFGADIL